LPRGAITSTSATPALLNSLGHRSLLSKYNRVFGSQNTEHAKRESCMPSASLLDLFVYSVEVDRWKLEGKHNVS
jgi:hypothetical protein